MTDTTSIFKKFIGDSPWVKFDEEGTPIEGIYKGVREEQSNLDPEKMTLIYSIEIDGKVKELTCGSKRLAGLFMQKQPKIGAYIGITRKGKGTKTTYELVVNDEGIPW